MNLDLLSKEVDRKFLSEYRIIYRYLKDWNRLEIKLKSRRFIDEFN